MLLYRTSYQSVRFLHGVTCVIDFAQEQDVRPDQQSLDRHDVEERLKKALGNPRRPSKRELLDHGIYLDATPHELKMSVSVFR